MRLTPSQLERLNKALKHVPAHVQEAIDECIRAAVGMHLNPSDGAQHDMYEAHISMYTGLANELLRAGKQPPLPVDKSAVTLKGPLAVLVNNNAPSVKGHSAEECYSPNCSTAPALYKNTNRIISPGCWHCAGCALELNRVNSRNHLWKDLVIDKEAEALYLARALKS